MKRIIKTVSEKYKDGTLEFVEKVFSDWANAEEGKLVRSLVTSFSWI